ncbi:MAG: hypothetical protein Q8N59_00825 [bacterium]|nr:hypothetical protein [bacterium]
MIKIDFSKKIYPSLTGATNSDWQSKLREIEDSKITEIAVFLSLFDKKERDHLYKFLLKSSIKKVPLVHLRDDSDSEDVEFFVKNFETKCFNIHEGFFEFLDKWNGHWDKIYLEMNYNNEIPKDVDVEKIAGFCIDFSHLKTAIARGSKEANYILSRKGKMKIACNHLNGYDSVNNEDKHNVTDLKDFDYLTTLPKYVFGEIIAIETYNSIEEQLKFKEYLVKLLNKYFESD